MRPHFTNMAAMRHPAIHAEAHALLTSMYAEFFEPVCNRLHNVVRGPRSSHRGGSGAQVATSGYRKSRSILRARARGRSQAASKVLGTARRNEPRAALARPGE